jgi:hemerythrin
MNTNIHWNSKLKVGSDIIDNQHKVLFDLIKDLNNAIRTGVSIRILDTLLGVLQDYAFQHFQTEEEYFKKHADSTRHCLEHYALLKKLNAFVVDFRNNRINSELAPSVFLENWLLEHIESFDRPFLSHETVDLCLLNESDSIDEFEPDLKDKRQHKRIPHNEVVNGNIYAHCYNATQLRNGQAKIVNMSPDGLMLDSARNHEVDDLLIVSCRVGQTFKMKEKVKVRSVHDQMYGVQFISPSKETIAFFTELYGSLRLNHSS